MILSKFDKFFKFPLFKQLLSLFQARDPLVALPNDVAWFYLWYYLFFILFLRSLTLSGWIISMANLGSSILCILSFLYLWLKKIINSKKSWLIKDYSLTRIKSSPVNSSWKRARGRALRSMVFVSLLIWGSLKDIWLGCSWLKWLYQTLLHFLVNF